jgi:hypothetical protein
VRADIIAHAGLNVRAGNGTHPFRAIAGLDGGSVDLSLTVSVPCLLGHCRVAGHDLSCQSACCGHDCHRGRRAAGDGTPGA